MSFGVALKRSVPLRLQPHPDRAINEKWRSWAREQALPRAIDLFAGGGGLSLGLEDAGYRVVLSVDTDPFALETHRHNFPGTALDMDLSDPARVQALIEIIGDVPIDLVAGGPPCQPFSRAGRSKIRSLVAEGVREAHDRRRDLWQSFLQVVEAVRPRAVLLENVPDMALGDELRTLRTMLSRLEAIGYAADAALVETHRYGVPQHRERLILVGVRDGGFQWPVHAPSSVSVKQAIGDLPQLGDGCGAAELSYDRPRSDFQKRARRGLGEDDARVVWDHCTRPVRDDDREAFNLMTPATRYSDLPERLRRYRADIFDDKYHRLGWDQLSRSITAHIAKDGYWYIHPEEARTLTVREAARIQTFPDRFRFAGPRSHQFRQIGNAVPPLLAEVLGRALLAGTKAGSASSLRSERMARARAALIAWGRDDAERVPWSHPGNPWANLAAILLDPRPPLGAGLVRDFLAVFPSERKATVAAVRSFGAEQPAIVQRRLERLARVAVTLTKHGWNGDAWLKKAALSAAEHALVSSLACGADVVLMTAAILRVTARLNDSDVAERRSLSAGRLQVGHLIGAGDDVPLVNAALHALGSTICRADAPRCKECPLSDECLSVRGGRLRVAVASRRARSTTA